MLDTRKPSSDVHSSPPSLLSALRIQPPVVPLHQPLPKQGDHLRIRGKATAPKPVFASGSSRQVSMLSCSIGPLQSRRHGPSCDRGVQAFAASTAAQCLISSRRASTNQNAGAPIRRAEIRPGFATLSSRRRLGSARRDWVRSVYCPATGSVK